MYLVSLVAHAQWMRFSSHFIPIHRHFPESGVDRRNQFQPTCITAFCPAFSRQWLAHNHYSLSGIKAVRKRDCNVLHCSMGCAVDIGNARKRAADVSASSGRRQLYGYHNAGCLYVHEPVVATIARDHFMCCRRRGWDESVLATSSWRIMNAPNASVATIFTIVALSILETHGVIMGNKKKSG